MEVLTMYNSVKEWLTIPYSIKPYLHSTGSGVKVYDEVVVGNCYPEGKVVLVKNALGNEVVSNKQLYVDGSTLVKVTDRITFAGIESSITSISDFYRGSEVDLKVIYL